MLGSPGCSSNRGINMAIRTNDKDVGYVGRSGDRCRVTDAAAMGEIGKGEDTECNNGNKGEEKGDHCRHCGYHERIYLLIVRDYGPKFSMQTHFVTNFLNLNLMQ
jgi:hypothetical protein